MIFMLFRYKFKKKKSFFCLPTDPKKYCGTSGNKTFIFWPNLVVFISFLDSVYLFHEEAHS